MVANIFLRIRILSFRIVPNGRRVYQYIERVIAQTALTVGSQAHQVRRPQH